ncbi:prepilin-type N-terminal cleavage/methylation domain-containing protein [Serpentinicella alkaliphila]|uniref:Prepilin-type N-terminal cleavage/methylation domain-containing protein n=1 Tax=Serpentinicella alkaliphila TaxID=1734049 RepID=A0A4R2TZ18_9FIRM|nr:prepilin-type N-terminal cleavage/methylation domain-containing protein [Serpentinicella alkaliphila]QUH26660.1 prepilin-type N-terminal cleavage/methylation domain-containing protein [Serpentinicella alkaliphila]TCQ00543.1 prepilin-type N-terminal cleavage/methylation domain-containing protein [Serpentinicella alkaliphila]
MRLTVKNNKGLTLLEMMIVLALLSIIMIVGYSIFSYSIKGYYTQTYNVNNQSNVRSAIRDITREIRRADNSNINVSTGSIDIDGIVYSFSGDSLYRNGSQVIKGIKAFNPEKIGNKITLEVISETKNNREFTLTTEIYLRE